MATPTEAPPATTSLDPTTLPAKFLTDVQAAYSKLVNKDSGGVFAVIVLSFLLTAYVWYTSGAAAGAPLLASFFICLAFFV
jgi:hypothetical protein